MEDRHAIFTPDSISDSIYYGIILQFSADSTKSLWWALAQRHARDVGHRSNLIVVFDTLPQPTSESS